MDNRRRNTTLNLVIVALLLATAWFVYAGVRDVLDSKRTGLVDISTKSDTAIITVSGAKTGAAIVGTGPSKVRLIPGDYLITGTDGGKKASVAVHVDLQKTTQAVVDFNQPSVVPIPDDVKFSGLDALTGNGLSVQQTEAVRLVLFDYRKHAKEITINTSTITVPPRNPDVDTGFRLNFVTLFDKTAKFVTVEYDVGPKATVTVADSANAKPDLKESMDITNLVPTDFVVKEPK